VKCLGNVNAWAFHVAAHAKDAMWLDEAAKTRVVVAGEMAYVSAVK
jgi:hypothetical protein